MRSPVVVEAWMGKEWDGKRGVRSEIRMLVCAMARVEVRVPILKIVLGSSGEVVGAEECTERERSVEVRVEPAIVLVLGFGFVRDLI